MATVLYIFVAIIFLLSLMYIFILFASGSKRQEKLDKIKQEITEKFEDSNTKPGLYKYDQKTGELTLQSEQNSLQ